MQNDTRIAVDLAKAVFVIAVSDRPGPLRPMTIDWLSRARIPSWSPRWASRSFPG